MVKTDLIKFTIKDSYKIINKLSRFYSKDIVSKWEKKVVKDINELLKKYKVKQFKVNENSYMGIVIDCLLLSDNGLKIIDPLGFKAPFVMELVSICAYEMFYNPKENIEILNDFINYFSYYTDEDTYKKALFCNLVKVYIPSIYEANDGGIRAAKWLKIIKELF